VTCHLQIKAPAGSGATGAPGLGSPPAPTTPARVPSGRAGSSTPIVALRGELARGTGFRLARQIDDRRAAPVLRLFIDSEGGLIDEARLIVAAIARRGARPTIAYAGRLVASAAVDVLMACGQRRCTERTSFLLHPSRSLAAHVTSDLTAADHRAQAAYLDQADAAYRAQLAARFKLNAAEIARMAAADLVIGAARAKEIGLVDMILERLPGAVREVAR